MRRVFGHDLTLATSTIVGVSEILSASNLRANSLLDS